MTNKHKVVLERFQEEFNNLNTTHERVAKYLGCDTSTVTKQYNGKLNISVDSLYKYSELFGVSIDYLLGKTNNKTLEPDINYVCDKLGLHEDTIQLLETVRRTDPDYYVDSFIRHLISTPLVRRIEEYRIRTEEADAALQEHKESIRQVIDLIDKRGKNKDIIKRRGFYNLLEEKYKDILKSYDKINNMLESIDNRVRDLQLAFSCVIRHLSEYDPRETYMEARELADIADKKMTVIRGKEINAFKRVENLCNYAPEEKYPVSDPWRENDGDY